MIPIDDIKTEDTADPYSFATLAKEAKGFLLNQEWCNRIRRGYLDIGWEGILAVFFFELEPARPDVDASVWVVVGDVPSAYLCNDNPNGPSALESYINEMQRWVDAVKRKDSVEELIPVNVAPTNEYAERLESRLDFIREKLLIEYKDAILHRPFSNQ